MEFQIIEKKDISTRSVYHAEEGSLMTYGREIEHSLCIDNTHLTMDIDSEGAFIGISGFLGNLSNIPNIKTANISYKTGKMLYQNSIHLEKGIGCGVTNS
ncbi:MAG: hypothetical protein SO170_02875 [Butyribacter sp.]|nr:hypothetical protein [bacterium]MDY3853898.1 hypothetical protein [Butyribacter sp.]